MKSNIFLLFICFVILLMNCSTTTKSDNSGLQTYSINSIPKKNIEANNNFSINLFRTLNREDGDGNIFISPVSASFALGMTANGAKGNTYNEMKSVLGYIDMEIDEMNNTYAALIEALNSVSEGFEFNLANAIWYDENLSIQTEFNDANKNFFNAKIDHLDFNDRNHCKNVVNEWVENETEEKIKDFTRENDFVSIMLLVNAIYFNASWQYQFNEDETNEKSFFLENNDAVQCEMMSQKNKFKFAFSDDYQCLELPYANENYSMILVKPSGAIDDFIETLSNEKIESMLSEMKKDSINITIPKVELVYEKELSDVLKSMGMVDAFDPQKAEFSNIFNELHDDIYIKLVRQKSFINVNEEGTEAAAATVVVMDWRSAGGGPDDEKYMDFNKPFLFLIMEKLSDSILFCGKIVNPTLGE